MRIFGILLITILQACVTPDSTHKIDLDKPEAARSLVYLRKLSSGYIGCDPKKISVKNFESEYFSNSESVQSWQASCGNEIFYCSLVFGLKTVYGGGGPFGYASCAKGNEVR